MLTYLLVAYGVAALALLPRLHISRIDALIERLDALRAWEIH